MGSHTNIWMPSCKRVKKKKYSIYRNFFCVDTNAIILEFLNEVMFLPVLFIRANASILGL